jgi:hypothetical protein
VHPGFAYFTRNIQRLDECHTTQYARPSQSDGESEANAQEQPVSAARDVRDSSVRKVMTNGRKRGEGRTAATGREERPKGLLLHLEHRGKKW